MAQVILPDGIMAIHGRMGDMIFRSRKQPDGTYKVFVHPSPRRPRPAPTSSQSRAEVGPKSRDNANPTTSK